MGRNLYVNNTKVWKYLLGSQPSEAIRIHTELGLGRDYYVCCFDRDCGIDEEYECLKNVDKFTLDRQDIEKLREYLKSVNFEEIKKEYDDISRRYEGMTEEGAVRYGSDLWNAYVEFNRKYPDLYFYWMIHEIVKYADEHLEEEEFFVESEL